MAGLHIGDQTVDASGDVAKVEAYRRQTVGMIPELGGVEALGGLFQVFAGVLEGVKHGIQQGVDARQRSAQPGLRDRMHTVTIVSEI